MVGYNLRDYEQLSLGYVPARRVNAYSTDPSQTLAQVAQSERSYYNTLFRPLNRQLVNDTDSTRLVDSAKENALRNFDRSIERNQRQLDRYGYSQTALDQYNAELGARDARGLMYDSAVNNARIEQYERNVGLRNELINMSRGIARSAVDDLGHAATLQANRENANEQIAAQNKAARNQMYGQIAGTALMAAMLYW